MIFKVVNLKKTRDSINNYNKYSNLFNLIEINLTIIDVIKVGY